MKKKRVIHHRTRNNKLKTNQKFVNINSSGNHRNYKPIVYHENDWPTFRD